MAIVEVQQKNKVLTTTNSFAIIFDTAPTQGNLLIGVYCTGQGGSNPNAITNPTNWDTAFTLQRSTGQKVICVYRVAGASESSTVTIQSASSVGWVGAILEYSGLNTTQASVLDKTATNDGGASGLTSVTSGTTAVTTVAEELVIAAFGLSGLSGSGESGTNSFVIEDPQGDKLIALSSIVAAMAAQETTASWTTSRTVVSGIATFKGAGIPPINAPSQAQAKINAFNINNFSQAQAKINAFNVNGFGQAQAKTKAIGVKSFGQAQARIKQTYPVKNFSEYDACGFEHGDILEPHWYIVKGSGGQADPVVQSTYVHTGTYAARVNPTSHYVYLQIDSGFGLQDSFAVRFSLYLVTLPIADVVQLFILDAGTNLYGIGYTFATGKFNYGSVEVGEINTTDSITTVEAGVWYNFDIKYQRVGSSNQTTVMINGILQGTETDSKVSGGLNTLELGTKVSTDRFDAVYDDITWSMTDSADYPIGDGFVTGTTSANEHWESANSRPFGQAQADIKATINKVAQAKAYIISGTNQFAQALAQIGRIDNLYSYIDELTTDDLDYDISKTGDFVVNIADLYTPTYPIHHIIRFRGIAPLNSGTLTVELLQGATVIASTVETPPTSWTAYSYQLSQSEINAIYDYSDLRFRVTTVGQSGISQLNLQVPSGTFKRRPVFAQAQAEITTTGGAVETNAYAQAQGIVLQTYTGPAQAQAIITATDNTFAQAQALILATYSEFGQAQSSVLTTYSALAQAQAYITTLEVEAFAQAQAYISTLEVEAFAQAQAYITTLEVEAFAQAQAYITSLEIEAFAQSQARIIAFNVNAFGQAQGFVLGEETRFGQAQAQITAIYINTGQAQAIILATYTQSAQAQGIVTAIYDAFAQAQAYISTLEVEAFGQAQAYITTLEVEAFAQAQGQITATYSQYAQAEAIITATYSEVAQAQADILATYTQYGQAQAQILATYSQHAQAQVIILATSNEFGQAQGSILATYTQVAQAQARVLTTSNEQGQAQGIVLVTVNKTGQAQTIVLATYDQPAQAEAYVVVTAIEAVGQAQAQITATTFTFGQSQSDIKATYSKYAQVQALIRTTKSTFGQAQAIIRVITQNYAQAQATIRGNAPAQAQAQIKTTSAIQGNAQAIILTDVIRCGQANSLILTINYAFSQAQAQIQAISTRVAQAQAHIVRLGEAAWAQAQAFIVKSAGYGQARAKIFQKFLQSLTISDRSFGLTISDRISEELGATEETLGLTLSDHTLGLTVSDRSIQLTLSDKNYVG